MVGMVGQWWGVAGTNCVWGGKNRLERWRVFDFWGNAGGRSDSRAGRGCWGMLKLCFGWCWMPVHLLYFRKFSTSLNHSEARPPTQDVGAAKVQDVWAGFFVRDEELTSRNS